MYQIILLLICISTFCWLCICRMAPPAIPLFSHKIFQANNKENIKAPHYWQFVGIHWSAVGSHKGLIMQKAYPCHSIIILQNHTHFEIHYNDVIMSAVASQITSLTIVYSAFYWGTDERNHQSSTPLAFVRGIHRWPVNSTHKGPVTRKMFPFDDIIMSCSAILQQLLFELWFNIRMLFMFVTLGTITGATLLVPRWAPCCPHEFYYQG